MSRVAARIAQTAESGINLVRLMTGLLHETWQSKISGVPFRMRYITDSTSKYGLVVENTGNTSWQFGASISRRSGSMMQTARSGWFLQICGPNEPLYPRLK